MYFNQEKRLLKFRLSEKKNLPHGFDKSADLLNKCQNHEGDFFKLCVLLKKSELYHLSMRNRGTSAPSEKIELSQKKYLPASVWRSGAVDFFGRLEKTLSK